MTPSPSADFSATAALLRATAASASAAHTGAVLAGLSLIAHGLHPTSAAALGLWAAYLYLHFRLTFDAELFRWLATGASTADLDSFLDRAGLRPTPAAPRSEANRIRGALRLAKLTLVTLILELLAAAVSLP